MDLNGQPNIDWIIVQALFCILLLGLHKHQRCRSFKHLLLSLQYLDDGRSDVDLSLHRRSNQSPSVLAAAAAVIADWKPSYLASLPAFEYQNNVLKPPNTA